MNANTIDARGLYYVLFMYNVNHMAYYAASAGQRYGLVMAWELPSGYLIKAGNNGGTDYIIADNVDDLAQYLEAPDLFGLDAIVDRANVRGADAIPAAKPDSDGPFYVLQTRYWYGPTEDSELVADDRGHPLEFATYEAAAAYAYKQSNGVYDLSHNESRAPSYRIITAGEQP